MQGIENKGYLMSFLIQDGLGMTFPRVATGFHRDKEETGRYNMKEGVEEPIEKQRELPTRILQIQFGKII